MYDYSCPEFKVRYRGWSRNFFLEKGFYFNGLKQTVKAKHQLRNHPVYLQE